MKARPRRQFDQGWLTGAGISDPGGCRRRGPKEELLETVDAEQCRRRVKIEENAAAPDGEWNARSATPPNYSHINPLLHTFCRKFDRTQQEESVWNMPRNAPVPARRSDAGTLEAIETVDPLAI
jgi:hypothetical protein